MKNFRKKFSSDFPNRLFLGNFQINAVSGLKNCLKVGYRQNNLYSIHQDQNLLRKYIFSEISKTFFRFEKYFQEVGFLDRSKGIRYLWPHCIYEINLNSEFRTQTRTHSRRSTRETLSLNSTVTELSSMRSHLCRCGRNLILVQISPKLSFEIWLLAGLGIRTGYETAD